MSNRFFAFRLGRKACWFPVTSSVGQIIYCEAVNYWLNRSPEVDYPL